MLKRILFFTVTMLMILSCEKKESVDFLTNGTWILKRDAASTAIEALKFDDNGHYVLESELSMGGQLAPVSGSITGEYERQGDEIYFTTTFLEMPEVVIDWLDDDKEVNIGQVLGSFYAYIVNGAWDGEGAFVDGIAGVESPIFPDPEEINAERIWTILSLTNDSLKVESSGIIKQYYKQ